MNLSDCVLSPPSRPKPIRDRLKVGLEDGFQHQLQRRLDNPTDHRNSESPNPSRPARLGISLSRTGNGRIRPVFRSARRLSKKLWTPTISSTSATVRPSMPGVRAPRFPATRPNAANSVAGSHTKLNRSFETAARIGHPPNDEVWPASPIPSATHPPGPPVVGRSAPTGGYWPPPAPIRRCGYGSLTSQPGSPPAAT